MGGWSRLLEKPMISVFSGGSGTLLHEPLFYQALEAALTLSSGYQIQIQAPPEAPLTLSSWYQIQVQAPTRYIRVGAVYS